MKDRLPKEMDNIHKLRGNKMSKELPLMICSVDRYSTPYVDQMYDHMKSSHHSRRVIGTLNRSISCGDKVYDDDICETNFLEKLLTGNDLLTEDSNPPQSFTEAQIRDFLLTTYTEYYMQNALSPLQGRPRLSFDGYINYLRNSK